MCANTKTCFKCGETLSLTEFYRHKEMADGHLNKCKQCTKDDAHKHRYGKGRAKVLAYDIQRSKTPERKQLQRKITLRWLKKHPKRRAANIAVNNALRSGALKKLPCLVCGDMNVEGHHPDYDSPLDVIWLCVPHHRQTHALI